MFATTTLFTLITLPVEFDASRRALATLQAGGVMAPDEIAGARRVLNAAALTYVAAFVTSLLTLLYWLVRLGLIGGGAGGTGRPTGLQGVQGVGSVFGTPREQPTGM